MTGDELLNAAHAEGAGERLSEPYPHRPAQQTYNRV